MATKLVSQHDWLLPPSASTRDDRAKHFTTRPAKHLLHVLLRAKHLQLNSNTLSYYPCAEKYSQKMYLMQSTINFLHKISVTSDGKSIVTKIRLVNTSCCPSIMCNEAYLRHWCVPSAVQCCGHRADYYPITLLPWHLTPAHSFRDMWPGHRALVTGHGNTATLCIICTHALKRQNK